MRTVKEEAASRLGLACLILLAIVLGLMTFLLITQQIILGLITNITFLGGGLGPLQLGFAIIMGIQIFAGTNILMTLGVLLNQLFFGSFWYLDYALRYALIGFLIGLL